MATCPHCNRNGISALAKWWSGSSGPTKCGICGGLSYVETSRQTEIHAKANALALGAVVIAFLTANLWVAVAGFIIAASYYLIRWSRVFLVPVSEGQASRNQVWGWSVFFALLVLVLVVGALKS